MNLADLNNLSLDLNALDTNNPGSWPLGVRIAAAVLLFAALVGGVIYLHTLDQWDGLEKVEKQEMELRGTFETKARKAALLAGYKQQLKDMEIAFATMLRQLPGKTEVENLLDDISQTGLASGLEFNLFKPAGETQKEFYAELPISIEVTGTYHEFGAFVSGVAALPRIVTLHDMAISKAGSGGEELKMSLTAKTYRYLEE